MAPSSKRRPAAPVSGAEALPAPSRPCSASRLRITMVLSLANLKECLVTAHNVHGVSVDLWFLTDYERCLWDKKYSINVQLPYHDIGVYPFLALDDGRIFLYTPALKLLQSYDPAANIFINVSKMEMDHYTSISMYTGRLLTLGCPLVANIRAMVSADKKGEVGSDASGGNDKS